MIGPTNHDTFVRISDSRIGTMDAHGEYIPHIGNTRQYWRDIILGVNDGLVSMLLLVAGVVGGGLDSKQVLLTGVAGAVAGAISMAAGEYLATKSQDDVLEAELRLEREHIKYFRDAEIQQLEEMFGDLGLEGESLTRAIGAFSESDEVLLNTMKALEFGAVDSERRSPYLAMTYSGILFLLGSAPSVIPFMLTESTTVALTWAASFSAIGLFAVGLTKGIVTRKSRILAGFENLTIASVGGVIAYTIGNLIGSGPVA